MRTGDLRLEDVFRRSDLSRRQRGNDPIADRRWRVASDDRFDRVAPPVHLLARRSGCDPKVVSGALGVAQLQPELATRENVGRPPDQWASQFLGRAVDGGLDHAAPALENRADHDRSDWEADTPDPAASAEAVSRPRTLSCQHARDVEVLTAHRSRYPPRGQLRRDRREGGADELECPDGPRRVMRRRWASSAHGDRHHAPWP